MTQTLKEKAAYLLAKGWKPGHREMEHNYDYKDLIRDIRPEAYTCDLAGLTVESLVVTCASLIDGGEPPQRRRDGSPLLASTSRRTYYRKCVLYLA